MIVEGHASRNITPRVWLSADAFYNVGGETSIDGIRQGNAAETLRLGAGMGARRWPGGDVMLNAEAVVAKPESEPNLGGLGSLFDSSGRRARCVSLIRRAARR
jgi:hypothetical protein